MTEPAENARVLVVGAGQAAGELAGALRAGGHQGPVTLVGSEPHFPYTRPPLSKAYLRGEVDTPELYLRPADFYRDHDVTVHRGVAVEWVDLGGRKAGCDDGSVLEWDRLVFATGGRPRRIADSGLGSAGNVHYVRTIDDVKRLRSTTIAESRFAVIGGGYVGLEVAAVLRGLDARVTVIEAADRLLARVTSPVVSEFFLRVHTEEGVDVRLSTQVEGYQVEDGNVSAVVLADDSRIPVDQVLIGIGMVPNDEVAARAGLDVDNGIVVDEFCRAGVAGVYAIGDVARHPDPLNGGLRRLESMPNAAAQARLVAEDILGRGRRYDDLPWFWSDQYDVKLQAAGSTVGCDAVAIRGDVTSGRRFSVFYLRDGVVRAVDALSSPADFAAGKALIASGAVVPISDLQDPSVPLRKRRSFASEAS
ncbi:NAD(P)/FAD-dependent oxidoreductase [Cryptosporangium aurantiacum]|uniref:3-phenylpropionate/trans-cinnamate dioxygenase ferredoxin reductase subunit n=1 Tax=Cryptosporangium aurantiacum TaxID=134849 RepID=A0A1M7RNY4_9ACTN|nr:FAD-dependent oxidoreductase [Cryptosporangium aurantiacum]SHN47929.1 3-phenylpropionate/trans-cinnamate dioxygenase ferredoxin reductase subunit [Cryptosporangium aurantiacum]